MDKKISFALLTAALAVSINAPLNAQTKAKNGGNPLMTVGKVQVPSSEFEYVYKKNNANAEDAFSEKSLREYLELYTNFKLKVLDAEKNGLDTTEAFRAELGSYRKQLAQPYLTEKEVTEKLIKEAYERSKEEVNASHILLMVTPDADPKDTLAAYNKIVDIRKKIVAGAKFEDLARQHSEDPSGKANGGGLGYFTALQMVYPFEDAAYKTPKGQISQPVRTRFGYHLIKVNDRRPSQGQVKVSHIMVKANSGMPAEDSLAAKQKADEIYNRVIKGENWDQLCSQFSDDNGSRAKGGLLPMFGTSQMIPSFEEAAFALAKPNDISKPVQTPYGWHIIKLIEKKPLESFTNMEPSIKTKVSKDSRSELNKAALVVRLKKENAFKEVPNALKLALTKADTSLAKGRWTYNEKDPIVKKPLFSVKNKTFTIGDFFEYQKGNQVLRQTNATDYLMRLSYKAYVEKMLLQYEEEHLEEKSEDYRMLVKEYRDGILLFQLMDNKVWAKALDDTSGLKNFFEKNRDKYTWGERAKATIYNVADKKTLEEVKAKMKSKMFVVADPRFEDIRFDTNSIAMTDIGKTHLSALIQGMRRDQSLSIEVSGHIHNTEKASWSKKRMHLVVDSLKKAGIDAKRIFVKDYGKTIPYSAEGEENQRVSIKVYGSTPKALEKVMNAKAPLTLQVTEGMFQRTENTVLDGLPQWKVGDYTIENSGRVVYVEIAAVEAPRRKTLDEARGVIISDYQTYLEKEWLENLHKEFPVKVNEVELKKLVKK
jgi:peptidyl-prolyl cis-trans isomerase SurA